MKTGKVGIAQFVLRNRDSLCMLKLKPHGQGLVLNALRFASEIRAWHAAEPEGRHFQIAAS